MKFYHQEIIFDLHLKICVRVFFGKVSSCTEPAFSPVSPALCAPWHTHRAAVLAKLVQGGRKWASPCLRRGALPMPLLVYAELKDPLLCTPEVQRLWHLSIISILNHNFHQKHTPKTELLFSLHRWERNNISWQLLLSKKIESSSWDAAEVPQARKFSLF